MPFVPVNVGRLSYGSSYESDSQRLRRITDFINAMVDVNGDFTLGDITIGRGEGRIPTNAVIGANALKSNIGGENLFAAGSNALQDNTYGNNNTAAGQNALANTTTGDNNSAFGTSSLLVMTTADANSAFGSGALSFSTGGGNSAFGWSAGFFNGAGYQSCYFGGGAANTLSDQLTLVTGPIQSVYIGYDCYPGAVASTNEIAIGYQCPGEGSNTTTIGNANTTTAHIYGMLTTSGIANPIATKTTTYTATSNDGTILCDATSGAFAVTLPAASTATGLTLNIKKIDSSTNAITIDGDSSETIDGSATATLPSQYDTLTIQSDGTEWWIL